MAYRRRLSRSPHHFLPIVVTERLANKVYPIVTPLLALDA